MKKEFRASHLIAILVLWIPFHVSKADSAQESYRAEVTKAWQTDHRKLGELIKYGNRLAPEARYIPVEQQPVVRSVSQSGTLEEWLAKSTNGPKNWKAQVVILLGILAAEAYNSGNAEASVSDKSHKILEILVGEDLASGHLPRYGSQNPAGVAR